ncbi:tryptophan synthase subunit alpha [Paenibacillus sp. SC116]|uniref:tryptophan synthase subunit alpha n=1 Tax=Paenibacillus sp. SC116 TaxID=2968986 RepID=UPI00215B234B|nr:tryptophan synthase subunit alpha [Paenibacillus sp. SC116]MCR8842952.1 tryptophan synthase subunit alpha [Paenibacillus sp. SC116]
MNNAVMNRMDAAFEKLKSEGKSALIPFITVGDPHIDITLELLLGMEQSGADIIELGVPYSDPLADGPVIERASARALQNHITIRDSLQVAKKAREHGASIPYVLFTYYNPVLQYGAEKLFKEMVDSEISGIIIPDLPLEESAPIREIADRYSIHLVPLVAPTSKERVKQIAHHGRGFIYCVSSLGVTGVRSSFAANIEDFLHEVRTASDLPIAIGFGISNAEHVRRFSSHCDGVVVGSAIVRQIEEALPLLQSPQTVQDGVLQICKFVRELKS